MKLWIRACSLNVKKTQVEIIHYFIVYSAESDLDMYCSPMFHRMDARHGSRKFCHRGSNFDNAFFFFFFSW